MDMGVLCGEREVALVVLVVELVEVRIRNSRNVRRLLTIW